MIRATLRNYLEVENIGPGLTRKLVVAADAGKYTTACKPGMEGDGIRAFEVTDSRTKTAVDGDLQKLLDTGVQQYASYVKDQTEQLVAGTKDFAAAYAAGDAAKARELYAATRMHLERIEPVAESFGDLDPKLDAREADLEPGQKWTGWHRAEKDLFPPAGFKQLTAAERSALTKQLVADTEELGKRTRTVELTPHSLGNGAKELLDEVATGKDAALAKTLDEKFAALQAELKKHAKGEGFTHYNELSDTQVKQLASLVDSLGEPLSKLTAAVVL